MTWLKWHQTKLDEWKCLGLYVVCRCVVCMHPNCVLAMVFHISNIYKVKEQNHAQMCASTLSFHYWTVNQLHAIYLCVGGRCVCVSRTAIKNVINIIINDNHYLQYQIRWNTQQPIQCNLVTCKCKCKCNLVTFFSHLRQMTKMEKHTLKTTEIWILNTKF